MPTQVLAPDTTIAESSDITVSANQTINLGLYLAEDDNLILPNVNPYYGGDLLLPDGVSILLLPSQAGGVIPGGNFITLKRKDPLGGYNETGIKLSGDRPNHAIAAGIWRVSREKVTSAKIGVQKD